MLERTGLKKQASSESVVEAGRIEPLLKSRRCFITYVWQPFKIHGGWCQGERIKTLHLFVSEGQCHCGRRSAHSKGRAVPTFLKGIPSTAPPLRYFWSSVSTESCCLLAWPLLHEIRRRLCGQLQCTRPAERQEEEPEVSVTGATHVWHTAWETGGKRDRI